MSFVDTGDTQYKTGQKIEFYHIPTDQAVDFKAYITDFSDDYSSNWESEEVYGRMDPIQTFKNTSREITISFDIVAGSLAEAKSNLEKFSKWMYDFNHYAKLGIQLVHPPNISDLSKTELINAYVACA